MILLDAETKVQHDIFSGFFLYEFVNHSIFKIKIRNSCYLLVGMAFEP